MDYFYVKPEDVTHGWLTVRGDESKHLVRVLRKSIGDHVFVTDGNDTMFETVVSEFGKTETRCDIIAMHRKYNEPNMDIALAVSLLKNPARFDYFVEKATELGVRTIIPISCQHTISQNEKYERWNMIALSAMKQCGRSWLPRIQPLQTFETLAGNSQHWVLKFIPHEKAHLSQTISTELRHHEDVRSLLIAIGPEGGFTEEEITLALDNGFKLISLGLRRLRAETAAVVAIAESLR